MRKELSQEEKLKKVWRSKGKKRKGTNYANEKRVLKD